MAAVGLEAARLLVLEEVTRDGVPVSIAAPARWSLMATVSPVRWSQALKTPPDAPSTILSSRSSAVSTGGGGGGDDEEPGCVGGAGEGRRILRCSGVAGASSLASSLHREDEQAVEHEQAVERRWAEPPLYLRDLFMDPSNPPKSNPTQSI